MWLEVILQTHRVHVALGSHWVLVPMAHSGARWYLSVIHTEVTYDGLLSYEVPGPRVRAMDELNEMSTSDLRSCRLEATA